MLRETAPKKGLSVKEKREVEYLNEWTMGIVRDVLR